MKDIFIENQRMAILQGLEQNITLSDEMAQRCLKAVGHSVSLKATNAIIDWLEERELVKTERSEDGLCVVKLTQHGREVAQGYVKEEGVETPIGD